MARKKSGGEYKVGHGKPPEAFRFKQGVSGNPSGRPKGSGNNMAAPDELTRMIFDEALRPLPVKEHGKVKSMQTARAITRSVNHKAANGDVRAQKLAFDFMIAAQDKLTARKDEIFLAAWEYKKQWAEDSKWRRQRGLPDPEILPHPNDLLLNFETRDVLMVGLTRDQEELIRRLIEAKEFFEAGLLETLKGPHTDEDLRYVLEEVEYCVGMLKKLSKALGVPWGENLGQAPDLQKLRELKHKVMNDLEK